MVPTSYGRLALKVLKIKTRFLRTVGTNGTGEAAAHSRRQELSILAYRRIRTHLLKVISLHWTDMRNYDRRGCPNKHRVTSAYSDCCCCPHCIEMAGGTSGLQLLTIFIARAVYRPVGPPVLSLQKLCIQSRVASVDLRTI